MYKIVSKGKWKPSFKIDTFDHEVSLGFDATFQYGRGYIVACVKDDEDIEMFKDHKDMMATGQQLIISLSLIFFIIRFALEEEVKVEKV